MSPDSVPDWWRGPGPEMIPTAGPPGGRPFTRQPHQYLPSPYMYTSYHPQHQVSNWHSMNSMKPEVNLSGITRAVQWETGKVVLKIVCMTNIIVCRVCEGGDLELPIDGVGTPAAGIGTWETVQQDGSALATVY